MLAAEQKASGSRPARKGAGGKDRQGGRQRCGEARQDACKGRCDSPQLLAPAGDLHRPEASLSASAPSSSAVPAARPSPTQQQAAGASMLLSHEASRTHGGSHVQPTAGRPPRSSRSCVLVVRSALSGPLAGCREQAFLAGGSCLCVEAPFFQSSASSPRQACPGSPLPSSSPLAQQGQPHPQPPWLPLGLPQPIPTCSLFQTLAQPHPHLTGPTWVPQPQLEPIGNRGPSPQPHSTSPPPLEPAPGT